MHAIARHPFVFLFIGAALVLGAIFFSTRGQSIPANSFVVSVGSGQLNAPGISDINNAQVSIPTPVPSPEDVPVYTPITFTSTQAAATSSQTSPTIVDTSSQTNPPQQQNSESLLQEAYSLIPTNFGPTSAPQPPTARTPEQQALYTYGNQAGLAILTLDNTETNATDILKQWLADSTSTAQIAQVNGLAQALLQAGTQLTALSDVPGSAAADNAALAQSLQTAGNQLKTVAVSGGDNTTLLNTMKTYDNDAEGFTNDFLALSDLFSLDHVTFSASDPGSVFQFSSAGSL